MSSTPLFDFHSLTWQEIRPQIQGDNLTEGTDTFIRATTTMVIRRLPVQENKISVISKSIKVNLKNRRLFLQNTLLKKKKKERHLTDLCHILKQIDDCYWKRSIRDSTGVLCGPYLDPKVAHITSLPISQRKLCHKIQTVLSILFVFIVRKRNDFTFHFSSYHY